MRFSAVLNNLSLPILSENHPLFDFRQTLAKASKSDKGGKIIVSDFHPGQLLLVHNTGLDQEVDSYLRRDLESNKVIDKEKKRISEKILEIFQINMNSTR